MKTLVEKILEVLERGEIIANIWAYDGLTDEEKRQLIDDIQEHEHEQKHGISNLYRRDGKPPV
jgi:DNA-binding winged helix-turn-helix (wHTH) protein